MLLDEKTLINVIDKSEKIVDIHEIAFQNSVKNISINAQQKTFLVEKIDRRDINYNPLLYDVSREKIRHIEKALMIKGYIRDFIK